MSWTRFFRRRYWDQERAQELEAYLEAETEENIARGMSPEEARYAAHRKLGNTTLIREEIYYMNSLGWLETLWQDLRFAVRMLGKKPGFTAPAVLTLALGIGAATTMFSVVEGAVLHPFPYPGADRLVTVVSRNLKWGTDYHWGWFPIEDLLEFGKDNTIFDKFLSTSSHSSCLMTGTDALVQFGCLQATANLFEVLAVPPLIGRVFTPADFAPGAPPVAVMRYTTWQSKFGGDPKIIGRTLILNDQPTTVIGVMPPRFRWEQVDLWIPETFTRARQPNRRISVCVVGYLKPGLSVRQAAVEVASLFKRYVALYPKLHREGEEFSVEPLAQSGVGHDHRRMFFILFGAVGLLFGIGCLNVANLLLARATTRETEIAIRASLGAGRARLVRQLMVESMLLGVAGALLGSLFAWLGLKAVLVILPATEIPEEAYIHINGAVLAFTALVTIAGTLLFGLAPALHAVRRDCQAALRSSGRGAGANRRQGRLRDLLVVSEVMLSLVLLTGAGLLMRSFWAVRYAKPGYDPHNLLTSNVQLPRAPYKTAEQINRFRLELLHRMRTLPGVESAALGSPPFVGGYPMPVEIWGKNGGPNETAQVRPASDDYFATLRVPLLEGRSISAEDVNQARNVAVINHLFASRYFQGEEPLGRQITMKELGKPPWLVKSPSFEVVGVVADFREDGPMESSQPSVYIPFAVAGQLLGTYLIRTSIPPALLMNPLRRVVATRDIELLVDVMSIEQVLSQAFFAAPRFVLTLMLVFAALGLALVLVGVYSVLSYAVTQRTREIGVRMALGAEAGDVLSMVLGSCLRWLLVGIAFGVPASIGLAKALQNRIWGLKPADPQTLAVVAVALTAVGLAACYFPARRATKVDPMVALRYE